MPVVMFVSPEPAEPHRAEPVRLSEYQLAQNAVFEEIGRAHV